MSQGELEEQLRLLTRELRDALLAEPFSIRRGYRVGGSLVRAHVVSAEGLGRTIEVLDQRLLRDLGLADTGGRMARLLGTVSTGYARALRDRTLDEQESIRRAAMVAREQAEHALRESEARFRHQATHDSLTGLPNRALFTDRLHAAFTVPGRRLAVCFVDLDGFKMVNDTLGHHAGDQLLIEVGRRLRRSVGEHLVARLGGDEFVILVQDTSCTEDALKVADAALTAINEPVEVDGQRLGVSASIGIVERETEGSSPSDVMRAADVTLHWAKEGGKRRWALFDAERNENEIARYQLSSSMPAALERGEFFVDYQPLVALDGGRLRGVEALVRWRHPTLGVLRPDTFVGLAEESGLIVRLGAWVLREACAQARRWLDVSPEAPFVSVNLAVRQIGDPGLIAEVTDVLERTGLPPARLQLEITESDAMAGVDLGVLDALASMGVRLAIDDFGTGYSNLAYLRHLPVRELKVAGAFVEGLRTGDSPVDEKIMATLVALAHTLDLVVTAENVETAGQAARLRAIGCDSAQGWHFGHPGPPSVIDAQLAI
ncbi:putative bifunctional diguanylate cyclase/phosphodiesterase [Catenuloplanes japonicus]|uniref:putative bifunctional diguanylate cyclase/phosphodiesterase n=1 Tax=Catenuloplanes japonicus TaxID=33876 RepID=UPI000A0F4C5E|nr:bifunctional diguanylate cyclase/phosphodiesterase [Catenuloplanes japonicus]